MSLSASDTPKEIKETPLTATRAFTNRVLHSFNEDPAERLFYFGLALLIVGLPLGVSFPLIYYGVLALLGTILICRYAIKSHSTKDHAK